MAIEFACEGCGKVYKVDDQFAGRSSKCKACGKTIRIPDPAHDEPADIGLVDEPPPLPAGASAPVGRDALTNLVTNSGTYATNPGQMRIDLVRYSINQPLPLALTIGGLVIAIICLFREIPIWIGPLVAAVVLGTWAKHLLRIRAKFISGDVCAAMIVNENPWLVAVYTDMRADRGPAKPCVRVIKAPMNRMAGGPPSVGKRVAAAALYQGPPKDGAWQMFDPTVANLATGNESDCARLLSSISPALWRSLDAALGRVDTTKPGVTFLWNNKRVNIDSPLQLAIAGLILAAIVVPLLFGKPPRGSKPSSTGSSSSPIASNAMPPTPTRRVESPSAGITPRPTTPTNPIPSATTPTPSATPTPSRAPSAVPAAQPPTSRPAPTPAATATPTPPPAAPRSPASRPQVVQKPAEAPKAAEQPAAGKPTVDAISGERNPTKWRGNETPPPAGARVVAINDKGTWRWGFIRKTEGRRFFIHYNGWGDTWDEWVGTDRLYDPEKE